MLLPPVLLLCVASFLGEALLQHAEAVADLTVPSGQAHLIASENRQDFVSVSVLDTLRQDSTSYPNVQTITGRNLQGYLTVTAEELQIGNDGRGSLRTRVRQSMDTRTDTALSQSAGVKLQTVLTSTLCSNMQGLGDAMTKAYHGLQSQGFNVEGWALIATVDATECPPRRGASQGCLMDLVSRLLKVDGLHPQLNLQVSSRDGKGALSSMKASCWEYMSSLQRSSVVPVVLRAELPCSKAIGDLRHLDSSWRPSGDQDLYLECPAEENLSFKGDRNDGESLVLFADEEDSKRVWRKLEDEHSSSGDIGVRNASSSGNATATPPGDSMPTSSGTPSASLSDGMVAKGVAHKMSVSSIILLSLAASVFIAFVIGACVWWRRRRHNWHLSRLLHIRVAKGKQAGEDLRDDEDSDGNIVYAGCRESSYSSATKPSRAS